MSKAIIPLLLDSLASAALIFFATVGLTLVFSVLRVPQRRPWHPLFDRRLCRGYYRDNPQGVW